MNDTFILEQKILYNKDCMEVMRNMPTGSVNVVVTDPPYKVISGGKPHKKGQPSGMLSKNDGKIFTYNDIKPEDWIPEVYRILKEGSHCYIMTNTLNMERYLRICRECGFGLHNILCWHKNNVTPSRWYMKNCEFTLFLRKGKAKTIKNVGSKMIHEFDNIIGNKAHPTEKPVELMKFYIANSCNIGDVVFDPFCGSGSTLIAAKQLGCSYIGCEIDPEYYIIANNRLKEVSDV